ncbi:iron-containing alcohol dehydrogenase [Pseudonocardia sp. CA-107938]|uniref:iron-containing alcohol dehydrogenase n=1 Tax=Pseudonocardia sp. CA-107938 TaxID=3240021 RepID=UPI003D93C89D
MTTTAVVPLPGSPLVKFQVPEVVFGLSSLAEAGFCAARLGARRPFVVTDPGLIESGWVAELVEHLRDAGLEPVIWHDVTPNPKDHEIGRGHERYRETGGDVIVGIGGGSCLDAAKAIAILSGNGGEILDYAGVDQVTRPIPPLLMIPSTAGTGSDVSQFCIVTDTAHAVKVTIMGRAVVPDISLTDPRLLATMPIELAAATGLDALTHAVESYVSLGHNPLADGHALSAARLVGAALRTAVEQPGDTDAQLLMAQASLEAGLAFSNAILGATHAMSHQVGGLLDLPHGVINGVLLPHVIRFNAEVVPERFATIAAAMGLDVRELPCDVAAEVFAEYVGELAESVGAPRRLGELGVRSADIERLAATATADACLATNPRAASESDIATIFAAAL